jgi:hypothetical protein
MKRVMFLLPAFVLSFQLLTAQASDESMRKMVEERKTYNQLNVEKVFSYRIQLFNGLSEGQARSVQNKFIELFPHYPTYLLYEQPEWKVRVGKFKNEIEAYRALRNIREEFPAAFKLKVQK